MISSIPSCTEDGHPLAHLIHTNLEINEEGLGPCGCLLFITWYESEWVPKPICHRGRILPTFNYSLVKTFWYIMLRCNNHARLRFSTFFLTRRTSTYIWSLPFYICGCVLSSHNGAYNELPVNMSVSMWNCITFNTGRFLLISGCIFSLSSSIACCYLLKMKENDVLFFLFSTSCKLITCLFSDSETQCDREGLWVRVSESAGSK